MKALFCGVLCGLLAYIAGLGPLIAALVGVVVFVWEVVPQLP